MEHDILGKTIKNARLHKGWSQERLAEILNCSPRHIMGIENENKKPSYWRLYNIIRTLDIPADAIFYPERQALSTEKDTLLNELINMLYNCNENTLKIISAAVQEAINLGRK